MDEYGRKQLPVKIGGKVVGSALVYPSGGVEITLQAGVVFNDTLHKLIAEPRDEFEITVTPVVRQPVVVKSGG